MRTFILPANTLEDKLVAPYYEIRQIVRKLHEQFDTKSLVELVDVASGSYIDEYTKEGSIYLRVKNIREYQFNLNDDDIVHVNPRHPAINDRIVAQADDIIVPRTGTLGKAAIVTPPIVGFTLAQHVTRLSFTDPDIDPYYAVAFLNTPLGKWQMQLSGYGSTRSELTHEALKKIRIPILKDIQPQIAHLVKEALEKHYESSALIRSAIHSLQESIGLEIDALPHSSIFTIPRNHLTDTFTARHYLPKYATVVKYLKDNFELVPLGRIADIERGKGTRMVDYRTTGIPFIRTSDLIDYEIDPYPDYYASEDTYRRYNQPLSQGDILFSIEGKIGQSAFILEGERCVFKNHIERIRLKPHTLDPLYVFLFLNTDFALYQAYMKTVIQATMPGMAHHLRSIQVPVSAKHPSHDTQFRATRDQAVALAKEAFQLKKEKKANLQKARALIELALEGYPASSL